MNKKRNSSKLLLDTQLKIIYKRTPKSLTLILIFFVMSFLHCHVGRVFEHAKEIHVITRRHLYWIFWQLRNFRLTKKKLLFIFVIIN